MKNARIAGLLSGAGTALSRFVSGWRGRRRLWAGGRSGSLRVPPWVLVFPGVLFLAAAGGLFYLMFVNPRMRVQDKATPYRAVVPRLPEQVVPVEAVAAPEPLALEAQGPNPQPDTEQTRRIGQVHYGNYCLFCHGRDGRGDGPVGRSYVPTPADLTAAPVQSLSDAALYHAMLTGVGHEPVLPYVILPDAPWYIVRYVRSLRGMGR
jgi:mono/diheme cytochrome c family protein